MKNDSTASALIDNAVLTDREVIYISALIAAREALTNTIGYIQYSTVDAIDAALSQIPIGQRPDIDRLLGR